MKKRDVEAKLEWLDDPEVFRVGQLPSHSDHYFYANEKELEAGKSSLEQDLNGAWRFYYSENGAARPTDFYQEDFDFREFDQIQVPCHIEMAGYDKIHYINTMYPWEGHFYRRPAYSLENSKGWKGMFSQASYNPVGSYIREFDLEEGLLGKRIVICFEGVEQAMYLWLNGHFIGYAEDSFTPSEFDLTPYVREKGNRLAVEVHKRSTAAFLEDQDFFRFFGIFRSVKLYGKPAVHLEDLWIKPEASDGGEGSLSLDLKISTEFPFEGKKTGGWAEICLTDQEGKACVRGRLPFSERQEPSDCQELRVSLPRQSIEKIRLWDNGDPYLYQLTIKLYDGSGTLTEAVPYPVGFRKLEIKDKVMYLNQKRLVICGVNRHEWSAQKGRSIGMEEMVQDMDLLLKNKINAVRTCHYPDQIPWYYLCDEKGIYMMAETNLESHGSWQKLGQVEPSWNVPGSLVQWKEAVLDRARSNFELFKNHVSVLFWSLGNESYAGENIKTMNRFFQEKKDGRLVHYEGVFHNRAYEECISDVESRMYAAPEQVREYLENDPKKPFILCEYMHDMGNSLGGMGSYMKLLDDFPMYQGGFIWDFIDQAIEVEDEVTGQKVLRYGGDFDDRPSDYEFSGNGILFADRGEKPAMQEVRYYYGKYR